MTKRIVWELDVEADTPEEAARQALAVQRRPDSTATVFDVTDEAGETVRVDLEEDDGGVDLLQCDNCGKSWTDYELENQFPNIPDLTERIEPGGIVPAGECPTCGALVYPRREPLRVLVLLDGGLVQDVLADREDVEAAVLDQDLDGVDESDIVEVVGNVDTLQGTLQAHEVTIAPVLVASAFRPVD